MTSRSRGGKGLKPKNSRAQNSSYSSFSFLLLSFAELCFFRFYAVGPGTHPPLSANKSSSSTSQQRTTAPCQLPTQVVRRAKHAWPHTHACSGDRCIGQGGTHLLSSVASPDSQCFPMLPQMPSTTETDKFCHLLSESKAHEVRVRPTSLSPPPLLHQGALPSLSQAVLSPACQLLVCDAYQ